jgi:putative ABC transport system permease protein
MVNEIRLALRTLIKAPAFTIVAVVTLALGIGATTAIFGVVYGVLLRPLPYRDPSRLVLIEAWRDSSDRTVRANYSLDDLEHWRGARAFESIAFAGIWPYALSEGGHTEVVSVARVSSEFFATVGGAMSAGRPLARSDDHSATIVISHRLWQRRFNGSPDLVGRRIVLGGSMYLVVGVAANSFQVPNDRMDGWVPATFAAASDPLEGWGRSGGYNPIARLEPNVTLARARASVDEVSRSLARSAPQQFTNVRADVVELGERLTGGLRPALLVLFAAVSLVLIVACANVANLMLTRHSARSREIAIRLALGASRAHIARPSIAEAAVLSVAGTIAGALVAKWLTDLLIWLKPAGLPRLDAIQVDGPVLAFAAVIAVATTLAIGLLPAFAASISMDALRIGAVAAGGPAGRRLRSAIAVFQVAASLVLVVGGVLLGRSLFNLLGSEIGVPTDHVAYALAGLAFGRSMPPDARTALANRVVERLGAEPGVEVAAASASLPPNRTRLRVSFTLVGEGSSRPTDYMVDTVAVTPSFFTALRIPLLRGRSFTADDVAGGTPVMMLSARTARRLFGERDPIGRSVPLGEPGPDGRRGVTVVGIAGDVKYAALDAPADGAIYGPLAQMPLDTLFFVARTRGETALAIAAIRRAAAAVDPAIAVFVTGTLEDLVSEAAAQPRFRTALLVTLATLALALAAIGLYGVVAHAVAQRTAEIAIRLALGARSSTVVRMVLRQGLQLAAAGILVGLVAAFALARTLTAMLYGIAPTDAWSFAAAAACLVVVTLVASYVPARRATRVDPLVALRTD